MIKLDPRTKLLLLLAEAIVVLGGLGGSSAEPFKTVFMVLPFLLLFSVKKVRTAVIGGLLLGLGLAAEFIPAGHSCSIILLMCSGILTRFVPSIMMGNYVMSSTKVSEFTAAMERMHVTQKITIPMAVMFRFFPTVKEECFAIGEAMKMRDIRFGGSKVLQMAEYRLVPMMTCSVKIGEELSAAALTRGLGSPVKRTNVCRIGFHAADIVMFLLCAAVPVWIIWRSVT